jgi:2-amino-4-hydroxy-6-hydroxymethyldihydropteridine diphosphokinase
VVVVAFGSNLGNRHSAIVEAADRVAALLTSFKLSAIIETQPVGDGLENDPPYLNAVGVGESSLSPRQLLEALLAIEAAAGRTRPHPGAPRTLDLDLILVGDRVADEPGLQVPHPRFRERRFVLQPLAELEPGLRDPVTGLTIQELLNLLPVSES